MGDFVPCRVGLVGKDTSGRSFPRLLFSVLRSVGTRVIFASFVASHVQRRSREVYGDRVKVSEYANEGRVLYAVRGVE